MKTLANLPVNGKLTKLAGMINELVDKKKSTHTNQASVLSDIKSQPHKEKHMGAHQQTERPPEIDKKSISGLH